MRKFIQWISVLAAAVALLTVAGAGCSAKMKASYHLERAQKYYKEGKFQQAEIEYKNVLRNAPNNPEAWSRLGIMYSDQGRSIEALPLLTKAVQLATNNMEVHLKLASVYMELGDPKAARRESILVFDHDPKNPQAPVLLAKSSVTTNQVTDARRRLQMIYQKGETAPLDVALGILSFKERDFKTAQTYFKLATGRDAKFSEAYSGMANLDVLQKDFKGADEMFQKAAQLAPVWSGHGVLYAQFKILSGDRAAGKQILENIVKQSPDYLPAWLSLANLAAMQTNYDQALTLVGNVLSRDPQNLEGLLFKARMEVEQGKTDQAIRGLEQTAKLFPKIPSVYYQLALAHVAARQPSQAINNLNRALNLNPQYAKASLLLAELQIRGGNSADAIPTLRQLVNREPQLLQARLLLADAYRTQGSADNAVRIYEQLAKSYPKNPQIPLLLGSTYYQQKRNADARAEFEKALKLAPDYLPALRQLVNLDLAEKRYTPVRELLQQSVAKHPDEAALRLLMGQVMIAQGDTNGAIAVLRKAIELQPDSQSGYLMLAQLYTSIHEDQKALAQLNDALAKNPKNVSAMMLMGMIYNSQKDYSNARDTYKKLLAISPDNVLALNNLACVYADHLNQLDKAYPLASRARKAAPTDPAIADTLGWILFRQGQYASALNLLQDSAAKLYSVPEVQFHLGMACYMMANEADAKSAFERALHLKQDFPETNQCRLYLGILDIDPAKADAKTRTWLEDWTAKHPDDVIAQERLGAVCEKEGLTDKAISAYEAAARNASQNVPLLENLARLYEPKNLSNAITWAQAAYKQAPNDPGVSHLLGHLEFRAGDYKWALTLLQLTAQAQPQDPSVLYDLSQAEYSMGRVEEARMAMQKALQSGSAFGQTAQARLFLKMTALPSQPKQALAEQSQVDQILKSSPDYVPALMARATIAWQKSDLSTVEQACQTALKHYPDFAPAQKELAMVYIKNPRKNSDAYEMASKARAALPHDPQVAMTLGIAVYRQHNYAQAASLLQEASAQIEHDPQLFYYLGMAQYELKHHAQCKTSLQRALTLNLSGTEADNAKRILAGLN